MMQDQSSFPFHFLSLFFSQTLIPLPAIRILQFRLHRPSHHQRKYYRLFQVPPPPSRPDRRLQSFYIHHFPQQWNHLPTLRLPGWPPSRCLPRRRTSEQSSLCSERRKHGYQLLCQPLHRSHPISRHHHRPHLPRHAALHDERPRHAGAYRPQSRSAGLHRHLPNRRLPCIRRAI